MSYVCQYRKYYPGDSGREVWCKIPISEGYSMIAGAMSLDGWLQFQGVVMQDGGYLRAEAEKMMKQKPNP